MALICSCGGGAPDKPTYESADALAGLTNELGDQYSSNAGYSSIISVPTGVSGDLIKITGAADMNSNIMVEKQYFQNKWQDIANITMEITGGEPKDFMFTLDEIHLENLPAMIAEAKQKLADEKDLKETKVSNIAIIMPDEIKDRLNDLIFNIAMQPKNGGATFNFYYKTNGELKDFRY